MKVASASLQELLEITLLFVTLGHLACLSIYLSVYLSIYSYTRSN